MQIFNNEITCYVGETFDLNFKLQNKDGSPYVIPLYDKPQYFVFSVSPSVYNDNDATRIWIPCSNMLRFKYTNIISSDDLVGGDNAEISINIFGEEDIAVFEGKDGNEYEAFDYLFKDSDGIYRYFVGTNQQVEGKKLKEGNVYVGTTITITFTRDVTSKWGAQSYVYDLRLVAGATSTVGTVTVIKPENVENKDIIIEPTKFKVLYDINEKGGNNSNGNN